MRRASAASNARGAAGIAGADIEATVTMRADDGSTLATSRTRLSVEGLIGTLALDYRFGAVETDAP
ncbi:hypothetical protein [Sinimarinibacterium thermocellulolyticum]|uniref:Uncharacterized protein n=1 Tax=Sinimarinibacterium thermocellulolyticum TaxID=3170016 RepID=A0ABV2ADW3_9GAMM